MDIMRTRLFILLLPLYFAVMAPLSAQRKDSSKIFVRASAQEHGIKVRWAVNTARAWKLSNQYGFEITRFTVIRNGKMLAVPESKVLNSLPLKPRPLNEWESIVQHDQYAAVIAQALFGKDFEVSGGGNNGIARIMAQSAEQEQRFALSLYAADNSFEAAVMAGWGWEDRTARPGEKYLYRVRSLVPPTRLMIDSSGAFIGIQDHETLPVPGDVGAIFGDKHVVLSWDYSILQRYYTAWTVERSKDGGQHFERATTTPVTNFNEKEKKASPRMYFIDSLQDNNTIYQYRIRGISPFGETGPPSAVVSGKGRHMLTYTPNIRSSVVNEQGKMTLTWEFEDAGNAFIKGFTLNQASRENGPYKMVLTNIAPNQRSLEYDRLMPSNYFTITAIAKEGESSTSFPVLVQPVDSIPPAPPVGLAGTIDSNGVVTLTWKANTEIDMLGYKIFRSSSVGEELSPLVDTVFFRNSFRDSVTIKSLNSRVYYAVTALDKRYNQSAFSAVLELKKPDLIPPSSPIFSGYKVEKGKVMLSWVNSHDEDVAAHLLYRKDHAENSGKWALAQTFINGTQSYTDITAAGGETYSYIILAKDSSGLESPPAQPVTVTIPPDPGSISVKALNASANRAERYIELSWKDNNDAVTEYQLYKGMEGQPLSLWKIVPAGARRITDDALKINTTYEYGIRAVHNGLSSPLKKVKITY
jgi:fibronectin type 3 domain-containing protein